MSVSLEEDPGDMFTLRIRVPLEAFSLEEDSMGGSMSVQQFGHVRRALSSEGNVAHMRASSKNAEKVT